jgi:hypothetical protein
MSHPNKSLRLAALVAASICIACDGATGPPGPPSVIRNVTAATFTATAGSAITGGVTVKVVDARGQSVGGSRVAFTVTAGDGTVSPHLILSDAGGNAHAEWTIGQTAGQNTLVASIEGVDSTTTFSATGTAGPATTVSVTPHVLRLPVNTTTGTVTGAVVDKYGNAISGNATTYTSRNTGLVTVNSTTGAVTVVSGSGTTYVVATGATFSDSSLVIVLKTGDTPCTGITAHSSLAVGEVITTGFSDNGICVDATTTGGEYALVPYFNSSVASALTSFTLSAFGNAAPSLVFKSIRRVGTPLITDAAVMATTGAPAAAFHSRIRAAEEQAMPAAAPDARLWYGSAERTAHRAMRTTVVPTVGDQMQLNVNPNDFCTNPTMHAGRVAAVTTHAVVVADAANPAGFTDAEYQSFGITFDTLVYALDIANFGAPTDIDENGGRVVLFFTHAVNEIGAGVLGYYYGRDLLPKVGPLGSCPGSNVGEIMYLLVPDAVFSKNFVVTNTVGTVAHEFQHMINAGRRLYINTSAAPTEERWLNEGLSHVAEELMFYHVSGLKPRQNVGLEIFSTQYSQTFQNYQFQNFNRLREYLTAPGSQSPIGIDDNDDDFATRGAIWSYLRYTADQRFSADEASFWFNLVNSNVTGLNNLYEVVGTDARLMMRDWTLAIFLDDLVPGMNAKYQQPSWNLRVAMATVGGYAPSTVPLPITAAATPFAVRAGGTVFARFGVNANQEAYVSAAGTAGTALPKNVLLALVRTK